MEKNITLSTAILKVINDSIYVVDQNYVLEFMNEAMIQDFGKAIGKKCHRIINNSGEKCAWCGAQEVFNGKSFHREIYFTSAKKTYDVTDMPLNNADGTISKLSICRDITQRKQREEKRR
jgi:two-component system NtrC family sensor kinase